MEDGAKHTLVLYNCKVPQTGEVVFTGANAKCSANLKVKGELSLPYSFVTALCKWISSSIMKSLGYSFCVTFFFFISSLVHFIVSFFVFLIFGHCSIRNGPTTTNYLVNLHCMSCVVNAITFCIPRTTFFSISFLYLAELLI